MSAWGDYKLGDYAVCYFPKDGNPWRYRVVKSRDEARSAIQTLIKSEEVLSVILSKGEKRGKKSPVIWATYYDGEEWPDAALGTLGADEYMP